MTNHEKKGYLLRYQDAGREISRLEAEIERWRSRAEQVTATLSKAPVQGGSGRKVEDASITLAALHEQLSIEWDKLIALRGDIEQCIASVPDDRLRTLLRYRYIDNLTGKRSAERLGIEERWERRLHRRAIALLAPTGPIKT